MLEFVLFAVVHIFYLFIEVEQAQAHRKDTIFYFVKTYTERKCYSTQRDRQT